MFKSTMGAALVAFVALLAIVAPVAASTGKVGAYSLTDTAAQPGATAKYRFMEISNNNHEEHWQLHRLVIRPPNMKAVAGKGQQTVGWSFTIERIECFEPPCYWEERYTSPVYMAVTSDSANAPFTRESVSVRVPTATAGLYHYRAIVHMFWYKPSGGVQGTAKARVEHYKSVGPGGDDFEGAVPGGIY